MAPKPTTKKNSEVTIPVKVVPREPLPTPDPVQQSAAVHRAVATHNSAKHPSRPVSVHRSIPRPSIYDWPEAKRRKFLWATVGSAAAVIILGWTFLISPRYAHPRAEKLLTDIIRLAPNLRNAPAQDSAAAKEIRQLNQQVFPQFLPK